MNLGVPAGTAYSINIFTPGIFPGIVITTCPQNFIERNCRSLHPIPLLISLLKGELCRNRFGRNIQSQADSMQQVEKSANFLVPPARQGAIQTFTIQLGLLRDRCHTTIWLGNIAKSQQEGLTISIFKRCIQISRRLSWIFQRLDQVFLIFGNVCHTIFSFCDPEGYGRQSSQDGHGQAGHEFLPVRLRPAVPQAIP